jgi:hypothetical protein
VIEFQVFCMLFRSHWGIGKEVFEAGGFILMEKVL